ncbi:MAG: cyclic nucleotide-binding domain-containing protein [Gammaproteobacteria bacterium]
MLKQLLNRNSIDKTTKIDGKPLNEWEPIKNLPSRYQDEILNRSEVIKYQDGDIIFMINEDDGKDCYLLSGSVELIDRNNNQVQLLTHSGRHELETIDHNKPRIFSARVRQECVVFVTRQTFFGTINSGRQQTQIPKLEVNEVDMESSSNWMLHLLNSSVFSELEPANLQKVFVQLDTIQVSNGEKLINQGDDGEFFYLIQHGDCAITRRSKDGDTKTLTKLGSGETFGERSILSGTPSDVGVEMLSDGILMRVPADIFNNSIKSNHLRRVSIDKADALISEGAGWLDVREPSLYRQKAIKNSINIDLDNLYSSVKGLNPDKKYIVCGESEPEAIASAFLFSSKGFTVYSLTSNVDDYLKFEPDKGISVEVIEKQEKPRPALEFTLGEGNDAALTESEQQEKLEENQPPQIKVNPEVLVEKAAPELVDKIEAIAKDAFHDIEKKIQNEIDALIIKKQKEIDQEINLKFKQYHQVTAKLIMKKLTELEFESKSK